MDKVDRSDQPHCAIINFSISVHPVLKDGSLDPKPLTSEQLSSLGIGSRAVVKVDGANKNLCIKNLTNKLEKFNG